MAQKMTLELKEIITHLSGRKYKLNDKGKITMIARNL